MANITWVPSKKALESGNAMPEGIMASFFDLDESAIPELSRTTMLTRAYRHMLNNEAASAWIAEEKRRKEADGDAAVVDDATKVAYIHDWRVSKRQDILDGKLGIRESAEPVIVDPVEKEAREIAFNMVRNHVLAQNGNFPYTVINARSLGFDVKGDGRKVSDYMAGLLNKSTPRGTKIWADAAEAVAKRNENVAAEDLGDLFDDAAQ